MIAEQIITRVSKIAQQMPEGFTFNPFAGRFPSRGYVVASAQTQDCFGPAGLFHVVKFVLVHKNYCVGGWKNENGTMQFDASMIYTDIEDAVHAAIANGQRAIFNLYTGQEIMACDYYKYISCVYAA